MLFISCFSELNLLKHDLQKVVGHFWLLPMANVTKTMATAARVEDIVITRTISLKWCVVCSDFAVSQYSRWSLSRCTLHTELSTRHWPERSCELGILSYALTGVRMRVVRGGPSLHDAKEQKCPRCKWPTLLGDIKRPQTNLSNQKTNRNLHNIYR